MRAAGKSQYLARPAAPRAISLTNFQFKIGCHVKVRWGSEKKQLIIYRPTAIVLLTVGDGRSCRFRLLVLQES